MTDEAREAGIKAYWRFFEAFNTREANTFTSALQFPHLRISARASSPQIIPKPEQHAQNVSWDRFIASGWDHTMGADPEVVHVSPDKVHIKAGWTRYTRDEKPILSNFVTYIITRVNDAWKIQCRFGIDPGPDGETEAGVTTGLEVVSGALASLARGNRKAAAGFFSYPHFNIQPGDVQRFEDAASLERNLPAGGLQPGDLRALQSGPNGVIVAFDASLDGTELQGIVMVTRRDGHWGIEGTSTILP